MLKKQQTDTAMDYLPQMNETTENFWQAWQAWDRKEPAPVFFRLYYDERGQPLFYSMEDLPGNYIDIDANTYNQASYNVQVINGVLRRFDPASATSRLYPNNTSGTCCDPRDVCVVVDATHTHTKWEKRNED